MAVPAWKLRERLDQLRQVLDPGVELVEKLGRRTAVRLQEHYPAVEAQVAVRAQRLAAAVPGMADCLAARAWFSHSFFGTKAQYAYQRSEITTSSPLRFCFFLIRSASWAIVSIDKSELFARLIISGDTISSLVGCGVGCTAGVETGASV